MNRVVIVGVVDAGPDAERQSAELLVAGADRVDVVDPGVSLDDVVDDAATAAAAVAEGARLLRTRNVREVRRGADTITAILDAP